MTSVDLKRISKATNPNQIPFSKDYILARVSKLRNNTREVIDEYLEALVGSGIRQHPLLLLYLLPTFCVLFDDIFLVVTRFLFQLSKKVTL